MILQVCDLSFRYTSRPLLEHTSFGLREGEILAILGPNGAGKTTLLKCINRILTPRGGSISIDGQDSRQMSRNSLARRVGWVPQHGEPSRITVYDMVLLGRKPHFRFSPGLVDHQHALAAIELLGLGPLALRFADELSGGEFQLAQIAQAVAQEPRVVLFDEPTSSLDISNQHHLMAKIRSLVHGSRRAAILTMHDINLALRYADSFLLMKQGRIHAAGGREIVEPEAIRAVYDLDTLLVQAGGHPLVVPV